VSVLSLLAAAQAPTHLQLVESYLRGDREAALRGLSELPRSRVERDAKAFRNRLAGEPAWNARDPKFRMLRAGTLLHLEKAREYVETADQAGVQQHLRAATIILEAGDRIEASVALQLFQRHAYLALGRIAQSCLEVELGVSLLNQGLERLRDDPALLLVRASLQEIVVTRGMGAAFAKADPSSRPAGAADVGLAALEREYRKVLALAPDEAEARLRLGRMLALLQRTQEAVAELKQVPGAGADKRTRYLALLFLGDALQSAGQLQAAIPEYAKAAALEPGNQTAWLALGHVLDRAGDADAARVALDLALGRGDRLRDGPIDPWWEYPFGLSTRVGRLLWELRAELLQ